jgi:hypothetical protein
MRIAQVLASLGAVAVVAIIATAAYGHRAAQGVPPGFSPESVAAVGTHDLWVLGGGAMCGGSSCNALVRSTDAGKHFSQVALPPQSPRETVSTAVFANARDGFAYADESGPLYVTRDGGESWHRAGPTGDVSAFATAGGFAYLVAGLHQFERSPVGRDSWQRVKLAVPRFPFRLAARGPKVWYLGPPSHGADHGTIAVSSDHGRSFTSRKGPCLSELGGTLVPAADRVVWAVCDTGNLSQTYRSTNDGRSFRLVRTPGETNGAEVAAFSAHAAVLDVGGIASLYRTTDRGARWTPVRSTPQHGTFGWLSSTTNRLGFAVIDTWKPAQRVWRTTDAGATWRPLPIR